VRASLDHFVAETATIATFYFRTERPVHYTAGQFTELTLPLPHPDARGRRRFFTLSSSPTEELLCITTRHVESGSAFKDYLFSLKPGSEVSLAEPMGDFVLPKLRQTPLIFVAGGIGITPFRSMFRWLADTGEQRPIKFIYGVHSEEDIIFQKDIEAARVHATIVVSEPSPAWGGERGKLSAELVLGLEQPSDDTLIYLSGPEPMIEKLAQDICKAGVDKRQIVTDFFPGYTKI